MKVQNNCKNCSKEYIAESRELNRGNGMFCSRKCSGEFKSKNTKPLEPNTKCSLCLKPIHIKQSKLDKSLSKIFYCSNEHRIEGSRQKIHTTGPSANPALICKMNYKYNCNNKTKSSKGICRSCTKKQSIADWLNGNVEVTWYANSKEPKSFVKEYLIKTRGDKCESCGYDKKRPDGSSKIQMDHIDGDYTNNLISNLRLLCPNCHEDTPTFGSRNSGGGRRYRLTKMDK